MVAVTRIVVLEKEVKSFDASAAVAVVKTAFPAARVVISPEREEVYYRPWTVVLAGETPLVPSDRAWGMTFGNPHWSNFCSNNPEQAWKDHSHDGPVPKSMASQAWDRWGALACRNTLAAMGLSLSREEEDQVVVAAVAAGVERRVKEDALRLLRGSCGGKDDALFHRVCGATGDKDHVRRLRMAHEGYFRRAAERARLSLIDEMWEDIARAVSQEAVSSEVRA
jgi:hypothetical protein